MLPVFLDRILSPNLSTSEKELALGIGNIRRAKVLAEMNAFIVSGSLAGRVRSNASTTVVPSHILLDY